MPDSQGTLTVIGLVVLGILIVVLSIFMILIVIAVVSKTVLRSIKGPLQERIAAQYLPDEILMQDLQANSFGRESAGVFQLRGNGGLVLTEKQLHFFMFLPQRELCIPLDAITELTFTHRHLGKVTPYNLLKVHFSIDGKPDSVAWYLTGPHVWKHRIEALKAGGSTN